MATLTFDLEVNTSEVISLQMFELQAGMACYNQFIENYYHDSANMRPFLMFVLKINILTRALGNQANVSSSQDWFIRRLKTNRELKNSKNVFSDSIFDFFKCPNSVFQGENRTADVQLNIFQKTFHLQQLTIRK